VYKRQDSYIADTLTGEGRCLDQLGRPAEAIAPLERALTLRRRQGDESSTRQAETQFALARALVRSASDPGVADANGERSLQLARSAAEAYRAGTKRFAPQLEEVEAWLQAQGAAGGP